MIINNEEDEPYELDENKMAVLKDFCRDIECDTSDLHPTKEDWTNTDRLYLSDLAVNTDKILVNT